MKAQGKAVKGQGKAVKAQGKAVKGQGKAVKRTAWSCVSMLLWKRLRAARGGGQQQKTAASASSSTPSTPTPTTATTTNTATTPPTPITRTPNNTTATTINDKAQGRTSAEAACRLAARAFSVSAPPPAGRVASACVLLKLLRTARCTTRLENAPPAACPLIARTSWSSASLSAMFSSVIRNRCGTAGKSTVLAKKGCGNAS